MFTVDGKDHLLWLREIESLGGCVETGQESGLEGVEDVRDVVLHVGRQWVKATAVAVELHVAVKAGFHTTAQFFSLPTGQPVEEIFHASGQHHTLHLDIVVAPLRLAGRWQHHLVVCDVGGHQRPHGIAQTGVMQGTFVLETQRPVVGRIGISQVFH